MASVRCSSSRRNAGWSRQESARSDWKQQPIIPRQLRSGKSTATVKAECEKTIIRAVATHSVWPNASEPVRPRRRDKSKMTLLHVILLAIVQGLAELLPVSSSAHVIVAEKLMGMNPAAPEMTLLLVMLHTGTMIAVIVYFWRQWVTTYFSSSDAFKRFLIRLVWATAITGIVGEALIKLIEHTLFRGAPKAQIEDLFGRLDLVA